MPSEKDEHSEIELLHEYVHAYFDEILPYEFHKKNLDINVPFGVDREIDEYFHIINDWFVAGYITNKCRRQYKRYVDRSYFDFKNAFSFARDDKDILIAGLVSAEAIYCLDYPPFNHL